MAMNSRITSLCKVLSHRSWRASQSSLKVCTTAVFRQNGDMQMSNRFSSSASSPSSPSAQLKKLESSFFKPKLVIFDKDGTLVCFHTMWTPWCTSLAKRIHEATGIDMSQDVYDLLGYDHSEKKVKLGALAENTHTQIKDKLSNLLKSHPELCPVLAQQAVEKSWQDTPENLQIKTTGNLFVLFKRLKMNGFVDLIVCGNDVVSKPKPDPHNALYICKTLGVDPSQTIMVGDTPADTLMGQEAKLGLTVGVLTGIGTQHDLADADVIVLDVNECVEMILPAPSEKQSVEKTVYHVTSRGISKIAMGSVLLQSNRNPFAITGKCHFSSKMSSSTRSFSTSSTNLSNKFSHIIVGAGSAGCVLTNRLSEDSSNSVLLLEAGPPDTFLGSKTLQWKIHMPAALMYNLCDDKYNWYYNTVPQKHCNDRVMYWPRGRVWGGSSSLNAMVYVRGHGKDYDRWSTEGATGWTYSECLPYFRKAQTHELGEDDYRGGSGPLYVSRGSYGNVLHKVFIEAGQQAGHAFSSDLNGYRQEGVGWFDMTIKKGKRWSTSEAYLRPALKRPNVKVESNVLVNRVLFDGVRAIGVEFVDGRGVSHRRFAESEVILSGGAINSPQLLMLSGIGDADHLKGLDIPVVCNLPGVGQNLQDHIEVYIVQKCKQPITLLKYQKGLPMLMSGIQWFLNQTGPSATTHLESGGFARTGDDVEHPDIQFHFLPSQVIDHGRQSPVVEAFQVHVGPMRATSKGSIKLKSKSPKDHPIIDPNYLATERDRYEMRQCVRLSREIFAQPAFEPYRGPEIAPGAGATSDEDLDAFIREKGDSAYHPSCTCKMGDPEDPLAVVGPDTKVLGVDNLRVVDASIMPSIVSGNLNAPTIMIAEKAADIIRGKRPLPASKAPYYRSVVKK